MNRYSPKSPLIFLQIIVISIFISSYAPLHSCSIPVFRYAMARWQADNYQAVLFYHGTLTEDERLLLEKLRQHIYNDKVALNLQLEEVKVSSPRSKKVKTLLINKKIKSLPAIAVWYPRSKGNTAPFWVADFSDRTVSSLIQSPLRKELTKRLIEKESGVFLYVNTGDKETDERMLAFLEHEISSATADIEHNMPEYPDIATGQSIPISFSTLTLSRTDQDEPMLLAILLSGIRDDERYAGKPIIFPVFGRGRVLYPLAGEDITSENLLEAIAFITGPCGCMIKAMNPGVDLLLSAAWDGGNEDYYEETQQLPALTGIMPDSIIPVTYETGQKIDRSLLPINGSVTKTTGLILIILVLVVGSLSFLITIRMRRNL